MQNHVEAPLSQRDAVNTFRCGALLAISSTYAAHNYVTLKEECMEYRTFGRLGW